MQTKAVFATVFVSALAAGMAACTSRAATPSRADILLPKERDTVAAVVTGNV